ncbi:hypothetical protein LTR53_006399 [Teratosphaeriaceae sp. CCFEE 6253]|nr:hypothetical protein LTR53_006399 [Teratosphaeriaceae sp. CCFEE 6253]
MDPNLPLQHERPELLTLPQEIQDLILNFAYARNGKLRIISKDDWIKADKTAQLKTKADYIWAPEPRPKVVAFMVSKAFFFMAAKAFIQDALLRPSPRCSARGYRSMNTISSAGIGHAWLRSLDMDLRAFPLTPPSALRSLTLSLREDDLWTTEKSPWEFNIPEADVWTHPDIKRVLKVRGLAHFALRASPARYLQTSVQHRQWDRNLQLIEDIIRPIVQQPESKAASSDGSMRYPATASLYPGSLVSATGSAILDHRTVLVSTSLRGARGVTATKALSKLDDDDIPDSSADLAQLLATDGATVMEWVRKAKRSRRSEEQGSLPPTAVFGYPMTPAASAACATPAANIAPSQDLASSHPHHTRKRPGPRGCTR